MLDAVDRYASLYPAGLSVGEVVPAVGILVDGVHGGRELRFDHLPRPCPGEVGKLPLLLGVLVAVDCAERFENGFVCHDVVDGLNGLKKKAALPYGKTAR